MRGAAAPGVSGQITHANAGVEVTVCLGAFLWKQHNTATGWRVPPGDTF